MRLVGNVLLMGFLLAAAGCDPAWSYRVASCKDARAKLLGSSTENLPAMATEAESEFYVSIFDGREELIEIAPGLKLRLAARVFTGTLTVEGQWLNQSSKECLVEEKAWPVRDREQHSLTVAQTRLERKKTDSASANVAPLQLPTGRAVKFSEDFTIEPFDPNAHYLVYRPDNPIYQTLELDVSVPICEGVPNLPTKVTFALVKN